MKKLMVTVLAAGMAAAAWADAHISYSGQLRAANGEQLTGKTTGNIEFRLYDAPTGTKAPLWARDIAVQIDANGCFAVELHDSAGSEVQGDKPTAKVSLDDIIANNANLYLGLTVKGSSGEINPRQKLLSNPRAVFAENVSLAKGSFTVTGVATLSGGIEAGDNKAFTVSKSGDVYASGALKVVKPATFVNGATFSAASTFSKGATFSEASAFTKGATFAESATFTKGATFAESATFTKGATFSESAAFTKGATFPNGISVTGGNFGVMPIGTIVMWYGKRADVPDGWAICDGGTYENKKTPNLCGRFPVGANADEGNTSEYAVDKKAGTNSLTLKAENLPPHQHTTTLRSRTFYKGGSNLCLTDNKNYGDENPKVPYTTDESKTPAQPFDNRPSYTALYFIMRVQ